MEEIMRRRVVKAVPAVKMDPVLDDMQPKIDKNVAIPILRRNKYPLGKMEIGDSFFATNSSIRSTVCVYALRHPPCKYKVDKEKDGYRVWRIK